VMRVPAGKYVPAEQSVILVCTDHPDMKHQIVHPIKEPLVKKDRLL
jgi:hypothetical protein